MIAIYGAGWCVPCSQAKKFMDRHDIEYTYHDIDADPAAYEHIQSLGYSSVPVFESDGKHWAGFDPKRLL